MLHLPQKLMIQILHLQQKVTHELTKCCAKNCAFDQTLMDGLHQFLDYTFEIFWGSYTRGLLTIIFVFFLKKRRVQSINYPYRHGPGSTFGAPEESCLAFTDPHGQRPWLIATT